MNIRTLCLLLLCAATFGACKETATSPTADATLAEIFPLKVGNEYNYHLTFYNSDGSIRTDTTQNVLVRSEQSVLGHPAFVGSVNGDTSGSKLFYYDGTSDLYRADSYGATYRIEKVLHSPMLIDQPFALSDTTYPDGSVYKTRLVLRSKNESVTVPARTFSCYHYDRIGLSKAPTSSTFDTTGISKLFFAPGVGLVLEKDYTSTTNNVQRPIGKFELTSYIVK